MPPSSRRAVLGLCTRLTMMMAMRRTLTRSTTVSRWQRRGAVRPGRYRSERSCGRRPPASPSVSAPSATRRSGTTPPVAPSASLHAAAARTTSTRSASAVRGRRHRTSVVRSAARTIVALPRRASCGLRWRRTGRFSHRRPVRRQTRRRRRRGTISSRRRGIAISTAPTLRVMRWRAAGTRSTITPCSSVSSRRWATSRTCPRACVPTGRGRMWTSSRRSSALRTRRTR